jgi:hypothetical protein
MKNVTFIIFLLFAAVCHAQTITPEQAKNYAGKKVTVCGKVTGTYTSNKGKGATFLNMGGVYPNNALSITIFKDDFAKFSYSPSALANKNICVTGVVTLYKGKPEIKVNSPAQIVVK